VTSGKIKVVFKVLEGCFEMFYKEDEEAMYPPQIRRADYGRGFYFCSSCGTGYDADKCPVCGANTRKVRRITEKIKKPRCTQAKDWSCQNGLKFTREYAENSA